MAIKSEAQLGKKAHFISLGCSKNLVDTEVMMGILVKQGYQLTAVPEEAEVIVVNTCAFISSAQKESIDTILQAADYKISGKCKILVATGCLSQRYADQLLSDLPEVDLFIGSGDFYRIGELLIAHKEKIYTKHQSYLPEAKKFERVLSTPPYSAWVKVAEGCNRHCTFCAIPNIKGRVRSRPIASIVFEVKQLVEKGVREINLVAQDLSQYGIDLRGKNHLTSLLKKLEKNDKLKWIRLLYFYPDDLSESFVEIMASAEKICHYLDMPIQHFSSKILRRMGRKITEKQILEKIKILRKKIPDMVLRTSILVGFPGETESDFAKLLSGLKKAEFNYVGGFVYSPEEGTAAVNLKHQVAAGVAKKRLKAVYQLQKKITKNWYKKLIGKKIMVVLEGQHPETPLLWVGRFAGQAPEIDGQIIINDLGSCQGEQGLWVEAEITSAQGYDLIAKVTN